MAWDVHRKWLVAHTGYARACSLVFARVRLVLISLFHCSLQTVMYYWKSSALLYALLYSQARRGATSASSIQRYRCCHMALGRDYNGMGNAFYNEQVEKEPRPWDNRVERRLQSPWRNTFIPP